MERLQANLFNGDCIKIMQNIPDHSVDVILCDLPYGTTNNSWDNCINFSELWSAYTRVVKENGAIILFAQGTFTAHLILSNEKMFKYKIVWEKSKATNFLNSKTQPLRKYEEICIFYKKQCTYNPIMSIGAPYNKGVRKDQNTGSYGVFSPKLIKSSGERYPTDIIYFKTAESEGEVQHPTQKPVSLCEYLIKTYSNPGDMILDNCMGSGTTGVAAINMGRNFIGIELNPEYFNIASRRIESAKLARSNNIEAWS